jgi:hypothetical protein
LWGGVILKARARLSHDGGSEPGVNSLEDPEVDADLAARELSVGISRRGEGHGALVRLLGCVFGSLEEAQQSADIRVPRDSYLELGWLHKWAVLGAIVRKSRGRTRNLLFGSGEKCFVLGIYPA